MRNSWRVPSRAGRASRPAASASASRKSGDGFTSLDALDVRSARPPSRSMIDHVLGRPSVAARRWHVLAVLAFWAWRLRKGGRNGPRLLDRLGLTARASKLSAWQTVVATLMAVYSVRNFQYLLGLQAVRVLSSAASKRH